MIYKYGLLDFDDMNVIVFVVDSNASSLGHISILGIENRIDLCLYKCYSSFDKRNFYRVASCTQNATVVVNFNLYRDFYFLMFGKYIVLGNKILGKGFKGYSIPFMAYLTGDGVQ